MTIQLPQSGRRWARPAELAKPDGGEPAALLRAVPASAGGYADQRTSRRWSEAPTLRLVRVAVEDKIGALEKLEGQLAPPGAKILSLHAHPNFHGLLNELDVSAPDQADASNLVAPGRPVGTIDVRSLPTTALSFSKTLALVARVAENPREHLCEIPDVAEIYDRPGLSEAAFQPGTGPRSSHHRPQSLS